MSFMPMLPAALILVVAGLIVPAAAVWSVRRRRGMALLAIGIGLALTTLLAVGDFYWEQDVNKGADRGWSLVYTLPAVMLAGVVYSGNLVLLALCSLPRRGTSD